MADLVEHRQAPDPRRRGNSPWPWILLVVVLTPVIVFVVFAVIALGGISRAWQTVDALFAGGVLEVRADQPSVLVQVRQLSRLETTSFTIEKVIEGEVDQGSPFLNAFLGDRLLFIAHGDVVAGVDLSQLREEDVILAEDGSITLRLPPAQILSHRLDNEQSRVYDRQLGLLARGDPELETRVRQEAEQEILAAACEGGILAQANATAQTQVRALLQVLGFTRIEFLPAQPGPDAGC